MKKKFKVMLGSYNVCLYGVLKKVRVNRYRFGMMYKFKETDW